MTIQAFSDGLYSPQRDVMTFGYIIFRDGKRIGEGYGLVEDHHERGIAHAEYMALYYALRRVKSYGIMDCQFYSDNRSMVEQINKANAIVKNWTRVQRNTCARLLAATHSTLTWIPREENRRANRLANIAYRQVTKRG